MSELCCSQVGITLLANEIKIVNYPRRTRKVKIPHDQKKEVTTTKCICKNIINQANFYIILRKCKFSIFLRSRVDPAMVAWR